MQSIQKTEFHLKIDPFARLFPELASLEATNEQLCDLAMLMMEDHRCSDSASIKNGHAIFGQFLAHDLTFEVTSKFKGFNDPSTFLNDRTISLDLDSMYGQYNQDFLYDANDREKLLLGKYYEAADRCWYDLQRNAQCKALIPDARNDENLIVSRLQVLFIEFHNKVLDYLRKVQNKRSLFKEARRMVIWHYHWLIIYGYLQKALHPKIFKELLENDCRFFKRPHFLPLEFNGAAFRFGHSQVRQNNRINERTEKGLFELGFFEAQDEFVDWHYFFDFGDGKAQPARRIDTKLEKAFHNIPFITSDDPLERSLPFRNLKRGVVYGLPSGEDVARRLCVDVVEIPEVKRIGIPGTPLWYYILREAEILGDGGEHLGPVGSLLVGECFFSILRHDNHSFLKLHPKWKPELGSEPGKFDFSDLINFVEE